MGRFSEFTNLYDDNGDFDDSYNQPEIIIIKDKSRDDFVDSAVIGAVTNSTLIGGLFGGSFLGGMFGDWLNKK